MSTLLLNNWEGTQLFDIINEFPKIKQRKEGGMPTKQQIQPVTSEEYEVIYGSPTEPRTPAALFDYMVERLVGVKLASYEHADPFRKRIPDNRRFLFVPPEPTTLDLASLMSVVEFKGKTGQNYLDVAHLANLIDVSQGPCLLLDVEDGRARLNVKFSVSREAIAAEGRIPYTTFRGIIHAFLLPVLGHHNMDLIGSRYGAKDVPHLYLLVGGPELGAGWDGHALPEWGAPSCGSVLVP